MGTLSNVISYQEWVDLPVAKDRMEEVVDGEIHSMPPNEWLHSEVADNLAEALPAQLNAKEVRGKARGFGLVIRRDPLTCRVPDLALLRTTGIVQVDGYTLSAPELVAEVLSPANTRAEMAARIRDYESISVPELWILSPEAHTFEVLYLQDGRLRTTQVLVEGQLRPRLFPETLVDATSVWPD